MPISAVLTMPQTTGFMGCSPVFVFGMAASLGAPSAIVEMLDRGAWIGENAVNQPRGSMRCR